MADMLYRATKYINAEDAMIAQEGKGKKRDSQDDARPYERRKSAWTNEKREDKRSRSPVGWTMSFVLLNTLLKHILM